MNYLKEKSSTSLNFSKSISFGNPSGFNGDIKIIPLILQGKSIYKCIATAPPVECPIMNISLPINH